MIDAPFETWPDYDASKRPDLKPGDVIVVRRVKGVLWAIKRAVAR